MRDLIRHVATCVRVRSVEVVDLFDHKIFYLSLMYQQQHSRNTRLIDVAYQITYMYMYFDTSAYCHGCLCYCVKPALCKVSMEPGFIHHVHVHIIMHCDVIEPDGCVFAGRWHAI